MYAAGYDGYVGLEYRSDGPGAYDWLPRAERAAAPERPAR
jgi:hydroxypyruvate isomerase